MPNALNYTSPVRSYLEGRQLSQQNALNQQNQQQRNTLFAQGQEDRQRGLAEQEREKQLMGVRNDLASYIVARKQGGPQAAQQVWAQLAPKYGLEGQDPEAFVPDFIRKNPGVLGAASEKVLADFLVPKEQTASNPPTEEIGVGGGMFQKVQVMPDGTTRPLGNPYQKSADAGVDLKRQLADQKRSQQEQQISDSVSYTSDLIDQLVEHPGLKQSVGAKGLTGGLMLGYTVPGTDAANFKSLFEQIKGRQFMEAFNSLRGGGQITEKEGQKATQAISRMDLAQSEVEFVAAAKEFQGIINEVKRRRAQGQPTQPAQPPTPPATPSGFRVIRRK